MTAPTRIGKYEIRRQIGRGAMGVVYEAFDPVIERRVAIKTLRLELFEPSQIPDVRARFKREAQSAGQLAHPHIVTVHDYGDHEGTPYIVMEFLAGNELSRVLGRGARLPLSEVVRLMTQLLGALTYAHERKVVHRDIKPGNIFILDDGSLKVVDFGLAHVEASNLTDTGALLGTPAYMSPEQFLALPIDERSDIFSAGVILYELLTGDKPFTGSVTSIMQKVLRQEPMEPSALNPTLSTAWDTVVKRAMAKKPDARFQSARQFLETIKQIFEKSALDVSVEVTLTGAKAADLGSETLRPKAEPNTAGNADTKPITTRTRHADLVELKQLGRYDLVHVLGEGVMGVVYEGIDRKSHLKVAILATRKGHMDDDAAAKEYSMRFMRKAQALARLRHPHIAQVYDYGEEGDVTYVVKEFIKGKDLLTYFDANERFELKEAVRIMCELLDALDFVHGGGIAHRDIKPANVMLDSQARVKLVGFGVGHFIGDGSSDEKRDVGTMVGTPSYMSPEQITGGNIDRRTDLFSAGTILYQFLTGQKAFDGSGPWAVAKQIIEDQPPVPSSINNTISPLFDDVVKKALSKTVEGRYQTAREFSTALKHALEGKLVENADKLVVGSIASTSADRGSAPAKSSSKKGLAIAAMAFVVAVGAATFYLSQRPREELAKPGPAMMTAQADKAIVETPKQEAAPKAEPKAPRALTRSEREAQRDVEAAAKAIGKPAEQVAALSPSVAASAGAAPSAVPKASRALTRPEREAQRDAEAAAKTIGAAPSAAAAPGAPVAPAAKSGASDSEAMYQQALAMEREGKAADAVRIYRRAARAGHGKAAKRLGDIFDRGVPGVSRDYAESMQWYQTARDLGETVEVAGKR